MFEVEKSNFRYKFGGLWQVAGKAMEVDEFAQGEGKAKRWPGP